MLSRHRLIWQALAIAALCAFIPVSIEYFDRPIATFFETHFVDIQGLGRFAALPGWLLLPALFAPFALIAWKQALKWKVGQAAMLFSISVIWTSAIVEIVLKRSFGRLGINAWVLQHAYGFHLFAGTDPQFRSFPSGEAAMLSAVICVLWPIYPRLRPLLALLAIVETFLILSLNWHFLSDVIAGALVGLAGSIVARRSAWALRQFNPTL
jgi:membrane-associated phospholipid phosphatase